MKLRNLVLIILVVLVMAPRFKSDSSSDIHLTSRGRSDLVWVSINVSKGPQGDAHLIRHMSGQTTLIDGGIEELAEENLLSFLKQNHIEKVHNAIISHPHFDHYGGILYLLKIGFPIDRIVWSRPTNQECLKESPWGCEIEDLELIERLASEREVPILDAKAFMTLDLGGGFQLVKVAQFSQSECPTSCDLNDTSLILRLDAFTHRVLFTGDLNLSLSKWLTKFRKDEIRADILKVPHHGTEGVASNEFFRAVGAAVSVVPASVELWCSKRSARVRAILSDLNSKTYLSGAHGHVFVHFFKNGQFQVETEQSGAADRKMFCQ